MSPLFRRRRRDEAEQVDGSVEEAAGAAAEDGAGTAEEPAEDGADGADGGDGVDGAAGDQGADVADGGDGAEAAPEARFDRAAGPFDVSEVESTEGYVDLGALLVPGREGMELRLEVDEAGGRVTSATVQLAGSAVQLQVFAAPRTEGIWPEIRSEIAAGIRRQGGEVDEVPGVFGRELIARIPVRTSDGRTGHQPARFAGVDGPRWFLRAVFHGAAVADPAAAAAVEGVVRDLVVVRGAEAMAPRELLSLRLPDQQPAAAEPAEPQGRDPLDPFERGPEITEIR